ncbi:sensor histidine kinase [Amycolatopsis jiangsuensis]|uniref:histidine kinase n=1 Tax=Amycolatopsis jiangsuensis TaxID=1181879 RepID=A0A840ITC5_9PSEU|nr:histidine kinase [Amycolatopsis jiangsuensis]MBB4685891.1 signal transduction histidine kinase [Amycolatopsis jiangsuensis]
MKEAARRRWRVTFAVALWVVLCLLVVVDTTSGPDHRTLELVYGLASVTVAVATARRWPAVSFAVTVATSPVVSLGWTAKVAVWEFFLMVVLGYLAGLRMPRVRAAAVICSVTALAGIPPAVFLPEGFDAWGTMLGVLAFAGVAPFLLGRYVRLRKELAQAGWRRAEEMESRYRLVARETRLRERARIASDMHDSLGHELSLIAVRAAALEVAAGLGDEQRGAAGQLRSGAAQATERLREIIGVLREDAAPVEPVQGDVAELVDRARASGIGIEARLETLADAPPMVARAVYRVAQEGLTNAAKHAPGAAVTVTVTSSAETTEVLVCNAAPPAGPLPGRSGRQGLIGLRERVRLVGGTLRAAPADGGFEVVARLPHAAAPAPEPGDDEVVGQAARERALARRDVRRSLVQAIVVPLVLFGVILGATGVGFLVQWSESELPDSAYARIEPGQPREAFAALLPSRQRSSLPLINEPPRPRGTTCEYYGTERSWLNLNKAAHRLCFAGDRLVTKDSYSEDEP